MKTNIPEKSDLFVSCEDSEVSSTTENCLVAYSISTLEECCH